MIKPVQVSLVVRIPKVWGKLELSLRDVGDLMGDIMLECGGGSYQGGNGDDDYWEARLSLPEPMSTDVLEQMVYVQLRALARGRKSRENSKVVE